jgi:ribosome-associated translation inhibitor RaiA
MQPTSTHHVEADRELKAYIYQQLVELQPYLIADSQMAVTVQQIVPGKEEQPVAAPENDDTPQPGDYLVKLVTTIEDGKLTAEGIGDDVYDAFCAAKGAMVEQLSQLQNALMDPSEREEEIQSYLDGSRTIH